MKLLQSLGSLCGCLNHRTNSGIRFPSAVHTKLVGSVPVGLENGAFSRVLVFRSVLIHLVRSTRFSRVRPNRVISLPDSEFGGMYDNAKKGTCTHLTVQCSTRMSNINLPRRSKPFCIEAHWHSKCTVSTINEVFCPFSCLICLLCLFVWLPAPKKMPLPLSRLWGHSS